jgi:hypothetical protein
MKERKRVAVRIGDWTARVDKDEESGESKPSDPIHCTLRTVVQLWMRPIPAGDAMRMKGGEREDTNRRTDPSESKHDWGRREYVV